MMIPKQLLLIVFLMPAYVWGQNKNNLFIDAGITTPGGSVTFDGKLSKHFELGVGAQTYDEFHASYNNIQFAAYCDLRPYWKIGKSLIFAYFDIGLGIQGGKKPVNAKAATGGLYAGLGVGYSYEVNKKGMGPYIRIGFNGNTNHVTEIYPTSGPYAKDVYSFDAFSLISLGFKI